MTAASGEGIASAVEVIRAEIDLDVSFFVPEGEKHLDPITVAVALSATLLLSFCRGFFSVLNADAEGLGRKTANWLTERISAIFSGADGPSPEDCKSVVSEAGQLVLTAQPAALELATTESQYALAAFLLEQGFPTERAESISTTVRTQAILQIEAAAKPA